MAEIDEKSEALKESYRGLTGFELKSKFHEIRNNHTKESMIDDLTKMSAVMTVMEEKGIQVPGSTTATSRSQNNISSSGSYRPAAEDEGSGINVGKVMLGLVICVVGIALTMGADGTIFYGAILVGGGMVVAGLFGA